MDALLVVNAGSSSLKFQIFEIVEGKPVSRIRGQLDGIGVRPRLHARLADGTVGERIYSATDVADLPAAVGKAWEWLAGVDGLELRAIGHRVVHGGPVYEWPVLIDAAVLERLASYEEWAPLHQPNSLVPIRLAMKVDPSLPQIACFDTAFHRGRPEIADCYALPRSFYQEGVRRYGFHGLSYEYIAERMSEVAPSANKVIVAHLGSGASMCAILAGRSVECTMGFTALDGIPMGTRTGQLDPGVVLYLFQRGMSHGEVSDLLYRESGLKGLSGISNDMRELLASPDPRAQLAIDHFVHRCGLQAGLLAAAMGGLDAVVFTAGIGENSPAVRALIADKLSWLGARLDHVANETDATVISTTESPVSLLVIPTDEELMIAGHTLSVLNGGGSV